MEEDNDNCESEREKVLFDLDEMNLTDLRLMAHQNGLSTEGGRVSVLSRLRQSFGFDFDDQIEVAMASGTAGSSKTTSEKPVKQEPVAKRAKKSPSTSTSATASSAEVQPGFGQEEDGDMSRRKRNQPLLDRNLEDEPLMARNEQVEASGKYVFKFCNE